MPVYSENEEVRILRLQVQQLESSRYDLYKILWAIAKQSGGRIEIDHRIMSEAMNKDTPTRTYNHPETGNIVIEVM